MPCQQIGATLSFSISIASRRFATLAGRTRHGCNQLRPYIGIASFRFDGTYIWHLITVTIEMCTFPPLQHPGTAIHHRATKTRAVKRIINRRRHAHFGGVGNHGPFAKNTFYFIRHPAHARHKGWQIEQKLKTVVWLNADNLNVFLRHQFAEQVQELSIPHHGLAQEREGKANRQLHSFAHQFQEHLSSRIVTIFSYFSKVAFIHTFVKKAVRNIFDRGSSWDRLCREFQTARLMYHGIDCQICNHQSISLNVGAD